MTILVTGATGNVGRQIVEHLVKRDADVRALVRDPSKADFSAEVSVVQGDFLDVDSLRNAMSGVSTLFLLSAVVPDEFTQALIALNVARSAGIERIVYLSVIHADVYVNVPHFAGKFGVERMIEQMGFKATILRPAYFIQNDLMVKDVITGYGAYPMPVGAKGLGMIDVRDIAEIAALELLRREQAAEPLPLDRINLVGPETLTGAGIAAIWSDVLARPIAYGGDNTEGFEQNLRQFMPAWMAYDMRLMGERFLTDGMLPETGDVERLTKLLGRPLRSYRAFASETVASA
ncbi:NAD-dependent epimerase/dehydratase family protein [Rhizobium laguerreae]|uniref:SDR family oxidoreductase n=1 Tax=Rhizobium laguerreae TaxID=1076926 RepID=UPI001039240E|nr:NmrA family NAD(P)-binding protein [Rhizobium laguerreae]MBY3262706.1 NmrA family NAD(P)-binding protein [Rhizobium laguerreae]MBY3270818.1 NmrA family NAD(P)-binding protein [Rhizobium laguerreae]MBY3298023.1 NmrA family NAD(P)-binding protein [Rhizobium laguerreae]MBY3310042.1 NmrA family NAD(P)-binding protein [Rhizobium laguerreae]MBY3322641.1 NmrA family NAD(P)-binding protein [Rhizobium laguerreae]